MIQIGKMNTLKILRSTPYGLFLEAEEGLDVLLPKRYTPANSDIGADVEVFIHNDSEDRLIASLDIPYVMVGEFASLRVKAVERMGAFLDWGLSKDLFLPFGEQTGAPLRVGQSVVVAVYLDSSDRIAASMRLQRHLSKEAAPYNKGDKVMGLVAEQTDLGFKCILGNLYSGLLYKNEVFRRIEIGQRIEVFIKEIRTDGKIDLSIDEGTPGYKQQDSLGEAIVEMLKRKGGFLAITDKTDPETIYNLFGVSKKKFKIGLGGLYKKRLIEISDDGIRLLK